MSFCTVVNCMDGRVQRPVLDYLAKRFDAEYVDVITEPGPVAILAADPDSTQSASILARTDISVNVHGSKAIAVVAHDDCAGNPKPKDAQLDQLRKSVALFRDRYARTPVIALWLDTDWTVAEIPEGGRTSW